MRTTIYLLLFFFIGVFIAIRSPFYDFLPKGKLVAYHGGGQVVNYSSFNNQLCAAKQLAQSTNQQIENTLESIASSLEAGFNTIHLNIHKTKDDQFAVFHDRTLDCATNGTGITSEQNMNYLKSLDAGFGSTFDNGKTHPWRGKGFKIPSLKEVVKTYPSVNLWISMTADDQESVYQLLEYKNSLPEEQRKNFFHITTDAYLPFYNDLDIKNSAMSVNSSKRCLIDYILLGWSRYFPKSCSNTKIILPKSIAKYLWGWPQQFASRAHYHGSEAYLWIKHGTLKPEYNLLNDGIGLIISDIEGVRAMQK